MADPVSLSVMAGVGIGSSILGGALQGAGKAQTSYAQANQADEQAKLYEYQAGVARVNKEIAEGNARYARTSGERDAQKVGMEGGFKRETTVATQAGRGLDVGTGSNARVTDSQTMLTQHDQAVTRAAAAKSAYNYEVQGVQQEAQANIYEHSAGMQKQAAASIRAGVPYEVGASILGAASSVSSKWIQASQAGLFA